MPGFHIIIDGIDGSGKSTIISAMRDTAIDKGQNVLDIKSVWKNTGDYPSLDEISAADLIVTAEPSTIWVGRAIREEIIHEDSEYSGTSSAMAFSLDREIHYRRIILPALNAGKIIIQDRGITSSIVYQPIQKNSVELEDLLSFPGNALALKHSPNVILIATISPQVAMERLSGRSEKKDSSIFEQKAMLEILSERYKADWFRKLFEERGTRFVELNAEQSIEEMRKEATALFRELISNK